ncbi:RNA polymerase sigma-70 factor (ECF subfamily) [Elusimicrobium posterum]|uniref:RNA polymerase sigma factor n=1 Tax=Elusimicrobium posterum TaxID=3116653 RepID=UPI003C771884
MSLKHNFEQIYKEYFKIIFAYIISRVRDEATAHDLAATLWEKVFKKLEDFDEAKGGIRQWLFTIARNETNMHFRMYYVKKFLSLTDFEDTALSAEKETHQLMEEEHEKQLLLNAMATLSDKERDILALKFYSGLNNREIATVAKISESNAGTIINRSISKLRVLMEDK